MTSPLNTLDIIIIHREKGGKPDSILPFNGHQAAHLTACVNLARAMLATEKGEQSFITLGDKLHRKSKPHQWLGGREMKVIVKAFLDEVKIKWPPLFIEETMENPDLLGATFRTVWPEKFDTRQFPISLNAGRIAHMCLAARLAKADHDTNSKEHQRYRRFMYNIAIVMVHEIGHIFITLLTGGESNTPPSEPGDEGFVHGEAGRDLETILFGGHHRYTRNLDEDETQSGDPHLVDREGKIHVIRQEIIDKTVKYEFEFPLPTARVMDLRPKETLGARQPVLGGEGGTFPSNLSPPLTWPESLGFYAMHDRFGGRFNPWTTSDRHYLNELLDRNKTTFQSGPQSDIRHLAFNPSLTPEPVQA